jgi:hypothetical protein
VRGEEGVGVVEAVLGSWVDEAVLIRRPAWALDELRFPEDIFVCEMIGIGIEINGIYIFFFEQGDGNYYGNREDRELFRGER